MASTSPTVTAPDHRVPVTTVPAPRTVKTRSTCSTGGPPPDPRARAARRPRRRAPQRSVIEPVARPRRHGTTARSRAPARAPPRPPRRRVREVGLGYRHHPAATPSAAQHRQVLARLRHHAVIGGHAPAETDRSRSPRRPSCARSARARARRPPTAAARRQFQARIAQLDRDASLPLLRQSVGVVPVSPSTSAVLPWSMWPAVPSVSGGARSRHRARGSARARGHRSASSSRACAGRAAAPPSLRADHGRVAGAQRARELVGARPAPGPPRTTGPGQLEQRQRAAADARRPPRSRSPPVRCREALGARRAARASLAVEHRAAPAARAARAQGRGTAAASPPAPPATACRSARRAPADAAARADRRLGPDHHPRLRAAEQLVAREARRAPRPRATERRTGGSSASSGTPSASTPDPTSSITGSPSPHSSSIADLLDEADRAEVRLVRAQDRAGLRPDRRARSRPAASGSWCRPRPAARPTVRRLRGSGTTRRSRPAARATRPARGRARERRRREQHRGRAVVHDDAASAPVSSQSSASTCAWRDAALAGAQVVLEVRVAAGRTRADRLGRRARAAPARGSCGRSRRSRSARAAATAADAHEQRRRGRRRPLPRQPATPPGARPTRPAPPRSRADSQTGARAGDQPPRKPSQRPAEAARMCGWRRSTTSARGRRNRM